MRSSSWIAIAAVIVLHPLGISAQDVEMLGRRYGTRPPAAYYSEMERSPLAYRFKRGRSSQPRVLDLLRGMGAGPALALGPRSGPVTGQISVPVLLGLFSDSPLPPPHLDQSSVQSAYFGAQAGTVTDYYREVSGDRIDLTGGVTPWVASVARTEAAVAGGISGLGATTAAFIEELLGLQVGVDWGEYDSDGPDGMPNSGDDDGFVDALAVMHPSPGAECDQSPDRIWSHKWSLSEASGTVYTTNTPAAGGGFIRVDDYFIQGVRACDGSQLNPIGVFVHEAGHAFGLPDLYDTRSLGAAHAGAGVWDLMASGTWGCDGSTPHRPCHMGAWSKAMLGWADVATLPPDRDDLGTLTLPPVETSGAVFRVDAADGSGEYFLLENRQRLGYDQGLRAEGLLVWQIDAGAVAVRWPWNEVNSHQHMAVWLRQADGLDDLGTPGRGRGDSGDPFPGSTGNPAFHAGSNPGSLSFQGTATGLTLLDIAGVADDVEFGAFTSRTTLTVATMGTQGAGGLLLVDGVPADPPANVVVTAPFAAHTLEAAGGEPTGPGVRRPFVQWTDDPAELRRRTVFAPLTDTTFVASYAGTQYELAVSLTGGVNGVAPGAILTTPTSVDLWFAPATNVEVAAVAQTGFGFRDWTGELAGAPNPTEVVMDAPVFAGADFVLTYGVVDVQIQLTATEQQSLQLATENGTSPVSWELVTGPLPEGLSFSPDGAITGATIDLGPFPIVIEAMDGLGLTATATVVLDVTAPAIPIDRLAAQFLLGGPALSSTETAFLDRQGNDDGTYDLGDFRAWVLANPSLPLSAQLATVPGPRPIMLPMRLEGREGSR